MRTILLALVGPALLAPGIACSADPAPTPTAPAFLPRSAFEPNGDHPDRTLEHLLKAAEHLEAAGLIDEAVRIRRDLVHRQARETLLGRKEAELECLQEEVDRLREQVGQSATILIRITALEVDRRKLGLKSRDFDRMIGFGDGSPATPSRTSEGSSPGDAGDPKTPFATASLVEANPARLPLFRELVQKGAVKILAEPNLTTTPRRQARFQDGSLTPMRLRSAKGDVTVANVWFGTQLDVLAVALPNHRLRLATAVELRQKQAGELIEDDGSAHPGITSRALSTEVEMQFGQTLVLGRVLIPRTENRPSEDGKAEAIRASEKRTSHSLSEAMEFIVIVTPEQVNAPNVLRPLEAFPAGANLEDAVDSIVPAVFDAADDDALGPPMPVLKRRPGRD